MKQCDKIRIFTGNANPRLARDVAFELGMELSPATVEKFSDGEVQVELNSSVRGKHAVIIQSTHAPTNDNLMELLLLADAARRSGSKRITAVIPYYGYSRQDRRPEHTRTPVSSRVVASMIETVGIDQVIVVDLHSLQQVGFFNIPVVAISAMMDMTGDIWRRYGERKAVIVSPDIGGVPRARAVAKELGLDLAVIDKRRPKPNESKVLNIIGDVKRRACIMIDDMVDTAGTLCHAAEALKEKGASEVVAYCTHPILSGSAYSVINNSNHRSELDELVVTDTIPLAPEANQCNIRVISVAKLISETMTRILSKKSISEAFL